MKEFRVSDPEIRLLDGLEGKRIPLVLGKGKRAFGYQRILLRTAQGRGVVFRCEPLVGSAPGKAFRLVAEEWNRKRDPVSGYFALDAEYLDIVFGIVQYKWDDDLHIDEGFFLVERKGKRRRIYLMPCGPLVVAFSHDIQTNEDSSWISHGNEPGNHRATVRLATLDNALSVPIASYSVSMAPDQPFQGAFPPGRTVTMLDDPSVGWRFGQFLSDLARR